MCNRPRGFSGTRLAAACLEVGRREHPIGRNGQQLCAARRQLRAQTGGKAESQAGGNFKGGYGEGGLSLVRSSIRPY